MPRFKSLALALCALAAPHVLHAATVQGTLRYAGLPVSTTFTNFTSGVSCAYSQSPEAWTYGAVNVLGNSYSVTGLSSGTNWVYVRLSARSVGQDYTPGPGDLYGAVQVTIGGQTAVTSDVDLSYAIHVTQPLDSATKWTGPCSGCARGAEVARNFTLAWEPVPLATSYRVAVYHWSCDSQVGFDAQTVTATSVQISQQTAASESFIMVNVNGFTDTAELTVQPYVAYTNCSWQTHAFHASASAGGRAVHPTNSRFIVQVAHAAGVAPTFWRSDLLVTNPTSSPITTTLTFTPREADGTKTYQQAQMEVPANACRTVTDVLDALFHTSGAGSLEVSPATLELASRVYTPAPAAGTYGAGSPPILDGQIAYIGGPGVRLASGGIVKGPFRTNLALVEVWGESAQLNVRLLDRDGAQIGQTTVSLQPFGNTQINDVVGSLGGPQTLADGQVTVDVTAGSGRVAGYLSIVDNGSQDSAVVPLNRR